MTESLIEAVSKSRPLAFIVLAVATLFFLTRIDATMVTKDAMAAVILPQSVKIDNLTAGQARLEKRLDGLGGLDPRIRVLEAYVAELQAAAIRNEE